MNEFYSEPPISVTKVIPDILSVYFKL